MHGHGSREGVTSSDGSSPSTLFATGQCTNQRSRYSAQPIWSRAILHALCTCAGGGELSTDWHAQGSEFSTKAHDALRQDKPGQLCLSRSTGDSSRSWRT